MVTIYECQRGKRRNIGHTRKEFMVFTGTKGEKRGIPIGIIKIGRKGNLTKNDELVFKKKKTRGRAAETGGGWKRKKNFFKRTW